MLGMPFCPNCKHKHNFWDAELMEYTHQNTKAFIRIKGGYNYTENSYGYTRLKETIIYGCPKCHIVFWFED